MNDIVSQTSVMWPHFYARLYTTLQRPITACNITVSVNVIDRTFKDRFFAILCFTDDRTKSDNDLAAQQCRHVTDRWTDEIAVLISRLAQL